MVSASNASAFTWVQAVPWALGIASLGWNWFNFNATRKLKRQDRDYDEWKIERDAVLQSLRAFEDSIDLLAPLCHGNHDCAELVREIKSANRSIAVAHGKLVREIERAREMQAPIGASYGLLVDGESAWDRLNSHFAEASELSDADEMRRKLGSVISCGQEIRRSIEPICKNRPTT